MIEIYDECKSAIINNKCSECNEFYSCYICDFVEERYQQGRADAINNFVIDAITEFQKFDKEHGYPTLGDISVILSDMAEQLKEEN